MALCVRMDRIVTAHTVMGTSVRMDRVIVLMGLVVGSEMIVIAVTVILWAFALINRMVKFVGTVGIVVADIVPQG